MRVLVVYCHPVPESFCAAVRDAAINALKARGDEVRLVDLYAEGFDPALSVEERRYYNEGPSGDPALKPHYANLAWAEGVLFVYPTWWYGLPAMLKGWLDRVWVMDVAFKLPPDGGQIISLVSHVRKLGVITTCGATWWLSLLMGEPGRKTIMRGIWALAGRGCRTMFLAHYDMDRSTDQTRRRFLEKVASSLRKW